MPTRMAIVNRTRLIILVCIVASLGALAGLAAHLTRSRDPRVILGWLRDGKGDKTELMMRLSLARGDVLGPMIQHATDQTAPVDFRCDVIQGLFKQYQRTAEDRIVEAIMNTRQDSDASIRRATAYGLAVFGDDKMQAALVDQIDDPDKEVRRQAYMIFAGYRWGPIEGGAWGALPDGERKRLVATAREAMRNEQDPDLNYLARAVVGRQVEILCERAKRARETAEIDKAEQFFRQALQLDPENQQAQVLLARHFFAIGDKRRCLQEAERVGALLKIPRLSSPPVIDGDPTEDAWSDAHTSDRFYLTVARLASRRPKGKSRFHIGHLDGTIYVAVLGYEPDLSKLRVTHAERDSNVWFDDCVELFFDPTMSGTTFHQFIVNAKGTVRDSYKGDSALNFNCRTKSVVFKDRGYWCCEFAIDAKELIADGITPESIWGINIVRARIGGASEHCQWWPTFGLALKPHLFPIAIFKTKPGPTTRQARVPRPMRAGCRS